ncbi:uncharacterized protein P174DRAFT_483601, partial [Aspergillus novofumigatus IBT 16806]
QGSLILRNEVLVLGLLTSIYLFVSRNLIISRMDKVPLTWRWLGLFMMTVSARPMKS